MNIASTWQRRWIATRISAPAKVPRCLDDVRGAEVVALSWVVPDARLDAATSATKHLGFLILT